MTESAASAFEAIGGVPSYAASAMEGGSGEGDAAASAVGIPKNRIPTSAECAARWGSLQRSPSSADDDSLSTDSESISLIDGDENGDDDSSTAYSERRRVANRRVSFHGSDFVREFPLEGEERAMKRRASCDSKASKKNYYFAKYVEEKRAKEMALSMQRRQGGQSESKSAVDEERRAKVGVDDAGGLLRPAAAAAAAFPAALASPDPSSAGRDLSEGASRIEVGSGGGSGTMASKLTKDSITAVEPLGTFDSMCDPEALRREEEELAREEAKLGLPSPERRKGNVRVIEATESARRLSQEMTIADEGKEENEETPLRAPTETSAGEPTSESTHAGTSTSEAIGAGNTPLEAFSLSDYGAPLRGDGDATAAAAAATSRASRRTEKHDVGISGGGKAGGGEDAAEDMFAALYTAKAPFPLPDSSPSESPRSRRHSMAEVEKLREWKREEVPKTCVLDRLHTSMGEFPLQSQPQRQPQRRRVYRTRTPPPQKRRSSSMDHLQKAASLIADLENEESAGERAEKKEDRGQNFSAPDSAGGNNGSGRRSSRSPSRSRSRSSSKTRAFRRRQTEPAPYDASVAAAPRQPRQGRLSGDTVSSGDSAAALMGENSGASSVDDPVEEMFLNLYIAGTPPAAGGGRGGRGSRRRCSMEAAPASHDREGIGNWEKSNKARRHSENPRDDVLTSERFLNDCSVRPDRFEPQQKQQPRRRSNERERNSKDDHQKRAGRRRSNERENHLLKEKASFDADDYAQPQNFKPRRRQSNEASERHAPAHAIAKSFHDDNGDEANGRSQISKLSTGRRRSSNQGDVHLPPRQSSAFHPNNSGEADNRKLLAGRTKEEGKYVPQATVFEANEKSRKYEEHELRKSDGNHLNQGTSSLTADVGTGSKSRTPRRRHSNERDGGYVPPEPDSWPRRRHSNESSECRRLSLQRSNADRTLVPLSAQAASANHGTDERTDLANTTQVRRRHSNENARYMPSAQLPEVHRTRRRHSNESSKHVPVTGWTEGCHPQQRRRRHSNESASTSWVNQSQQQEIAGRGIQRRYSNDNAGSKNVPPLKGNKGEGYIEPSTSESDFPRRNEQRKPSGDNSIACAATSAPSSNGKAEQKVRRQRRRRSSNEDEPYHPPSWASSGYHGYVQGTDAFMNMYADQGGVGAVARHQPEDTTKTTVCVSNELPSSYTASDSRTRASRRSKPNENQPSALAQSMTAQRRRSNDSEVSESSTAQRCLSNDTAGLNESKSPQQSFPGSDHEDTFMNLYIAGAPSQHRRCKERKSLTRGSPEDATAGEGDSVYTDRAQRQPPKPKRHSLDMCNPATHDLQELLQVQPIRSRRHSSESPRYEPRKKTQEPVQGILRQSKYSSAGVESFHESFGPLSLEAKIAAAVVHNEKTFHESLENLTGMWRERSQGPTKEKSHRNTFESNEAFMSKERSSWSHEDEYSQKAFECHQEKTKPPQEETSVDASSTIASDGSLEAARQLQLKQWDSVPLASQHTNASDNFSSMFVVHDDSSSPSSIMDSSVNVNIGQGVDSIQQQKGNAPNVSHRAAVTPNVERTPQSLHATVSKRRSDSADHRGPTSTLFRRAPRSCSDRLDIE